MFFKVLDYAAVNDGETLTTKQLQAAIDACAESGGGEVVVPPGRYLTGTLTLKTGVTFNISAGATILGSPNLEDYQQMGEIPKGDLTVWHLIQAFDADRVTIKGGGTIDGQGQAYWYETEDRYGGKYFLANANNMRPSPMLHFQRCRDLRIQDVNILGAAGWVVHPTQCERVWITGISLRSQMIGPNTDGLDIAGCKDVFIRDCHIETGDDAICFKTEPGSQPCERITVSNCVLASRTCAIKFGTGSHNDFRQITVENCVFYASDRGIGMHPYDGGNIEDITFNNIVMESRETPPNYTERAISFDVRPRAADRKSETASKTAGIIRNITFSNMTFRGPCRVIIGAETDFPVENLRFFNITHDITKSQELSEFENPSPSPMQYAFTLPHLRTTPAYYVIHGVNGLIMENVTIRSSADGELSPMNAVYLENVTDARIDRVESQVPLKDNTLVVEA